MFYNMLSKCAHCIVRVIHKFIIFKEYFTYKGKKIESCQLSWARNILKNVYSPEAFCIKNHYFISFNECNISIIIPVFNGEKYLKECIDSLLNQCSKYKIEILCVDDGSTDNSCAILKEYSDKPFIKIIHQANAGISAARNRGIEEARGEYLLFIDNDDFIDAHFIDILLDKAYKANADIVKCGYQAVANGKKRRKYIETRKEVLLRGDKLSEIYKFNGFCWGMLIKRSVFSCIRFPVGYWYEDMITRLLIYPLCKTFVYINKSLYYYRFHSNNASAVLWKSVNKKSLDQYYLAEKCFHICEKLNVKFNQNLCLAYQYELGYLLYERTKGLDEIVQKAIFILACDLNDKLIDKCDNYWKKGSISEKLLNLAFVNRDFETWKSICKLLG